jgi:hypothetical protein
MAVRRTQIGNQSRKNFRRRYSFSLKNIDLAMAAKSQEFQFYEDPVQMEPLLPSERTLAPLLEQAHDLQRAALTLSGTSAPPELRLLLRAMNSYYNNKMRGLLVTDSPHGKLRFGVPQHALRFYFPHLWPEAEAGAQ